MEGKAERTVGCMCVGGKRLGAYAGFAISQYVGFWPALLIAPVLMGLLGALFDAITKFLGKWSSVI